MGITDRGLHEMTLAGLGATGLALVGAGLAKIAAHGPGLALASSLCGASGKLTVVAVAASDALHCWGCPVAFSGGLLLLAALVIARQGAGERGPFAPFPIVDHGIPR